MDSNSITEVATKDNFDEARYLAANPDVRDAGISARLHLDVCGLKEGRLQFKPLPDAQRIVQDLLRTRAEKPVDLDGFSQAAPSHQNALDLCKGEWFTAMPAETGLTAGHVPHFDDDRVTWAAPLIGGIGGKNILELGPYEGYNAYTFDRMGADRVLSIEGSRYNFLKCLIMKSVFNLRVEFMLGDFNRYTPGEDERWDVVWASGVLYHLADPIDFLLNISGWGNTIFIWTQYYDGTILDGEHADNRLFDATKNVVATHAGRQIELHHRRYPDAAASGLFAGGAEPHSYWMKLDDILFVLRTRGFSRIEMGVDNPYHGPGPACFFLAMRA